MSGIAESPVFCAAKNDPKKIALNWSICMKIIVYNRYVCEFIKNMLYLEMWR